MYNVAAIRKKQGKRKIEAPQEVDSFSIFDRPLPYYCTIIEQKWGDNRFLQLSRQDKGDWGLLVDFLWHGCGSITRDSVASVAKATGIPIGDFYSLIERLLKVGLLIEKHERFIQPELRKQYLHTCKANSNMKRTKDEKEDEEDNKPPF